MQPAAHDETRVIKLKTSFLLRYRECGWMRMPNLVAMLVVNSRNSRKLDRSTPRASGARLKACAVESWGKLFTECQR